MYLRLYPTGIWQNNFGEKGLRLDGLLLSSTIHFCDARRDQHASANPLGVGFNTEGMVIEKPSFGMVLRIAQNKTTIRVVSSIVSGCFRGSATRVMQNIGICIVGYSDPTFVHKLERRLLF